MRWLVIATVLSGACGDDINVIPPDAPMADADPTVVHGDFFGEHCDPPSSLGNVSTCRDSLPFPKAYCTPEGTCRPFCGSVSVIEGGTRACKDVGGKETYAFPTSAARVCYCVPPN